MSALEKYTIIINDERFTLLRDQILRDAPNYFTAFFDGPFKESSGGVREMELNRDPYLFKFVHLYLCGYDILPLPNHNIPSHFSEESRLKCLLLDARFYGLDALAEELEAVVPRMGSSGSSKEGKDGKMEKETWKVFTRDDPYEDWTYVMTLFDREAFNLYMEGAMENSCYRLVPMDVSDIAKGLESIYSYSFRNASNNDVYVAIGKVEKPRAGVLEAGMRGR